MIRQPVQSSNLKSVGYDPATKTMEIEFHSGRVYVYFDVPASIHHGLMTARSKGTFFRRNVRVAFSYKRVDQSHAQGRLSDDEV